MKWTALVTSIALLVASCGASDGRNIADPERWEAVATTDAAPESPAPDAADAAPASSPLDDSSATPETPAPVDTDSPHDATSEPAPAVAVEDARATAAFLIDAIGDEATATSVLLLSSDLGYTIDQIIDAAANARLQPDGVVLTDEGGVLAPAREPVLLLEEHTPASGFRSPPEQLRVSDVADWAGQMVGDEAEITSLVLLLILLLEGYSLEQIVSAILTDQAFDDKLRLIDAGGGVVPPELPPRRPPGWITDSWIAADRPEPTATTSEQPSDTTPSNDDMELAELVERAVGVYAVTDDVAGQLAQSYISPGVEVTDVVTTGEMVIGLDGIVSGEFSYTVTQRVEFIDAIEIVVHEVDFVFAPTQLVVLDDGLSFEAEVTAHTVAAGADFGSITYVSSGIVDVDLGQIVVSRVLSMEGGETVRFEHV